VARKIPFKTLYAVHFAMGSRSMATTTITMRALRMNATDIPQGFEPHFRKSPFTDPWEPLYSKRTDKSVIMGLRLAKPHTNARGLIHGGLIASLADNAMGYSCAHQMDRAVSLVTIGLAVDFVGSAQLGQWLAVEPEVIRTGNTICFAQCLIRADDAVIARANGTFRVVPKKE
jgi:uncharacterized protein (TIGR00369 family)